MNPDDTFLDLMSRMRRGDDDAASKVFHRFANRLVGLARQRLDARVRPKVDADDVLQSVFKSFFARHAAGEFDLGSWEKLWTLLTVITVRKCGRVNRYFRSAGRNAEVAASGDNNSIPGIEALSSDPSPAEIATVTDLVEGLLRDCSEHDREIVVLALQGFSAAQIAAQLQRAERSVYRVMQRVRARLERMQLEDVESTPPADP
jgi:RNA polymerase sigma-70 factor, ECF subfamily